jgi:hypothetical protein
MTDMTITSESSAAGREYATACAAHYADRDLPLAIQLFENLAAAHADSQEASYCRMQVQNIANAVVPKQELLNAQMKLVRAHREHTGPPQN